MTGAWSLWKVGDGTPSGYKIFIQLNQGSPPSAGQPFARGRCPVGASFGAWRRGSR